jgi:hypothetical protein
MNEPTNRQSRPDCTVEVDVTHGGDIEVVRCEEAIAALLAGRASKSASVDSMLTEFTDTQLDHDGDPNCPAA